MNRMRLMVLSGLMMLGSLGLGTSSAQAQSVGGTTPRTPRYYGAGGGYYGGYYFAPQAAPSYNAPRYSAPAAAYTAPARSPSRSTSGNYDPSGRHDGLARPWLKPLR